jgi:NADH-quinone oxidoreductase subunit E
MINIKEQSSEMPSFSSEIMSEINRIISQYPEGKQKSALLRVLHIAQENCGGWLSVGTMNYVAQILNIKPIEVYEVATFYSMYNLKPVGKFVFEFCHTATCEPKAKPIIEYTCKKLGIQSGQTTSDGMFTIKEVECLGACGYAPMMQLGHSYQEYLTTEKMDTIIENLRNKGSL